MRWMTTFINTFVFDIILPLGFFGQTIDWVDFKLGGCIHYHWWRQFVLPAQWNLVHCYHCQIKQKMSAYSRNVEIQDNPSSDTEDPATFQDCVTIEMENEAFNMADSALNVWESLVEDVGHVQCVQSTLDGVGVLAAVYRLAQKVSSGFEISKWMHLSVRQVDCKNHLSECTIHLSEIHKANATYVKIRNTQSSVGQVLQLFHLSDCHFYSSQTIGRVKFRTLKLCTYKKDECPHLPGTIFTKSSLFSLSWKTTCLERPQNLWSLYTGFTVL